MPAFRTIYAATGQWNEHWGRIKTLLKAVAALGAVSVVVGGFLVHRYGEVGGIAIILGSVIFVACVAGLILEHRMSSRVTPSSPVPAHVPVEAVYLDNPGAPDSLRAPLTALRTELATCGRRVVQALEEQRWFDPGIAHLPAGKFAEYEQVLADPMLTDEQMAIEAAYQDCGELNVRIVRRLGAQPNSFAFQDGDEDALRTANRKISVANAAISAFLSPGELVVDEQPISVRIDKTPECRVALMVRIWPPCAPSRA